MKTENAEELREEFIKKYAPSILDKNSNTSFVLDLAVLLEFHASLREKETSIKFAKHIDKTWFTAPFQHEQYEKEWDEYTKHKEG